MMRSFVATTAVAMVFATARPSEAKVGDLERLRQAEVVVVRGSADHMEHVMQRAQVRYVVVDPEDLPQLPLHGQQVLMVNCTGEMSATARERVRRFVSAGGFLYTTDHAVHYLLEKTFPGYVRWNGKTWRGVFKVFVNPRGTLTLAVRLPPGRAGTQRQCPLRSDAAGEGARRCEQLLEFHALPRGAGTSVFLRRRHQQSNRFR